MTIAIRSTIAFVIFSVIFVAVFAWKLFEQIGPDEVAVIQSPVAGTLTWYTTPGLAWQGFGEVTVYKRRSTYSFECVSDGKTSMGGIEIRFNDGGHGTICGSIQYDLPRDEASLNIIHANYRSQERLQKELVETVTNKAIYLVGTLMSSKESYAEKRNDLIHFVSDQVQNGVYRTRQKIEWIKDPITGQDKQVITAEILMDKDGHFARQEESVLNHFGIRTFNFTITRLPYDSVVETQIRQQQQITMQVQTSIAELRSAEQRALTVEQQGKANAAAAKWEQEVIKARAVTEAESQRAVAETQALQRVNVAKLDRDAAELTKQKDILLGQGQAEAKRLVLEADGALTQKLEAYVRVNENYADALKNGTWVPLVVNGGNGQNAQANGAIDLINLLTAKAAKDMQLDLTMQRSKRQ